MSDGYQDLGGRDFQKGRDCSERLSQGNRWSHRVNRKVSLGFDNIQIISDHGNYGFNEVVETNTIF